MNFNVSEEVRKPNINARNIHIFHLRKARFSLAYHRCVMGQVKNNPCSYFWISSSFQAKICSNGFVKFNARLDVVV